MEQFYENHSLINNQPQPVIKKEEQEDVEKEKPDPSARFEMITGIILAFFTAILALSGLAGDSYGESILLAESEKTSAYDWYSSKSIKQTLTEGQRDTLAALLKTNSISEQNNFNYKEYLDELDKITLNVKNAVAVQDLDVKNTSANQGKVLPEDYHLDLELAKVTGALESLFNNSNEQNSIQTNIEKYINELDKEINRYKKEKNEILQGSAAINSDDWTQDVDGELGKVIGAQEWEEEIELIEEAGSKMDLSGLFLEICLVMGAISLVMQRPTSKWVFLSAAIVIGLLGSLYMVWGMTIVWPF